MAADEQPTLVEFLRARLDEDEQTASACVLHGDRGEWTLTDGEVRNDAGHPVLRHTWEHEGEHIARHDPTRVVAEVEAKRRIIDEHYCPDELDIGEQPHCGFCDKALRMNDRQGQWPCLHLRLLALPYADHPDYREEWRP